MTDSHLLYRYVVKCDRAFNARLERAAKAEGVSPTTFVQQHFNLILGETVVNDEVAPSAAHQPPRQQIRTSPEICDKILNVLRNAASADGVIEISYRQLSGDCGASYETVRRAVNDLLHDGRISHIRASGRGSTSIFRVISEGQR